VLGVSGLAELGTKGVIVVGMGTAGAGAAAAFGAVLFGAAALSASEVTPAGGELEVWSFVAVTRGAAVFGAGPATAAGVGEPPDTWELDTTEVGLVVGSVEAAVGELAPDEEAGGGRGGIDVCVVEDGLGSWVTDGGVDGCVVDEPGLGELVGTVGTVVGAPGVGDRPGITGPDVGFCGLTGAGIGLDASVVRVAVVAVKRMACPLPSMAAQDAPGMHETAFRRPNRSRSVRADQAEPS
jgi:hypothetical protein